MQNERNEQLLQSMITHWSEIKILQQLLSETDDDESLLAIFEELEKRFDYKGKLDRGADDVEL
jgi:hypothetical protein